VQGAVQAREPDARQHLRARPAGVQARTRAGVASRRLRDRRPPHRSSPEGDAGARGRTGAQRRLRRGDDERAAGRRHLPRRRVRLDGAWHVQRDDGGLSRGWPDDDRVRRVRAGDRRPRRVPHEDGRAHRGRRQPPHRHRRCTRAEGGRARGHPRPHRGEHVHRGRGDNARANRDRRRAARTPLRHHRRPDANRRDHRADRGGMPGAGRRRVRGDRRCSRRRTASAS